jgi:hypothetical protein
VSTPPTQQRTFAHVTFRVGCVVPAAAAGWFPDRDAVADGDFLGADEDVRAPEIRPDWVPSQPRDQRCSHGPPAPLTRRLPPLCGLGPVPRSCHHLSGGWNDETSSRVHFRPPARPSPCPPPLDDTGTAWAFTLGFAPVQAGPAHARQGRDGLRALARNYAVDLHRPTLQSASSLRVCDLMSHAQDSTCTPTPPRPDGNPVPSPSCTTG